jgi:hypothetical protein
VTSHGKLGLKNGRYTKEKRDMKDKNKNATVDETADDTEIGKLISEIVESGEPDLAEAIELTHEGLGYAKKLTAITFGTAAADDLSLVLKVYDRINDRLVEDDEDDDD